MKIMAVIFVTMGLFSILGLVNTFLELGFKIEHGRIYAFYLFLLLLNFSVAYGIYYHKRWAFYGALVFLCYLIVNFFITVNTLFPLQIIFAGIPFLIGLVILTVILIRKHHHFIH